MEFKNISKNILIVEDDPFNIQLIETILSKIMNATIVSTDDGDEALQILSSGEPQIDMVLLDLHLPGKSGREILQEIRTDKAMDNLPVLIITVDGLDEIEFRKMGANDFILKPYDINMFTKKLSRYFKED